VAHEVIIGRTAYAEAEAYAQFILDQSNDELASNKWWNGLLDAIFSLESMPGRCPVIPERSWSDIKLHQLLYESHRVIFQIGPDTVHVLRVYHASQKPLTRPALRRAIDRADPL